MKLEHVAIWTQNLEQLKDFYVTYFGGLPNDKYNNPQKQFSSYFIRFKSGARLELMTRPDIPANANDSIVKQYLGITHLAFGVDSMDEVDRKAEERRKHVFKSYRVRAKLVMVTMNLKPLIRTTTGLRLPLFFAD